MRRIATILILAISLLLLPSTVSAAGVGVVSKTGDGIWIDDTWQVEIYPAETKVTTLTLYNSSSSSLDVEISILPASLDGGNLTFKLSQATLTMPRKSYTAITLSVKATGGTTPGTYTTELRIKFEIPTEVIPPEPIAPTPVVPTPIPWGLIVSIVIGVILVACGIVYWRRYGNGKGL